MAAYMGKVAVTGTPGIRWTDVHTADMSHQMMTAAI